MKFTKKEMFQTSLCLVIEEAKCTTEYGHEMTDLSSRICYMATNQISNRYNEKNQTKPKNQQNHTQKEKGMWKVIICN